MPLTTSGRNRVLNRTLGSGTPATVSIALMRSRPQGNNPAPADLDEPSGGNYARVTVDNTSGNWPSASGGEKTNGNDIIFPTASSGWGTLKYFAVIIGGDVFCWGLISPRRVLAERAVRFTPGSITITAR